MICSGIRDTGLGCRTSSLECQLFRGDSELNLSEAVRPPIGPGGGDGGGNVFPSHKTFDLTPPNHFLKIIHGGRGGVCGKAEAELKMQ
ncbi:hypothetical protein F2P81_014560 [Scophthalmus maximus]|uniref:Uncharacterized protein n=1 Tax=Scophthalmus maximus TaxID=52904 RepID=A0A6A4SK98_SCOMX|nr:hypothetical protein F2P81_014560 [Scophthalmus maximus]